MTECVHIATVNICVQKKILVIPSIYALHFYILILFHIHYIIILCLSCTDVQGTYESIHQRERNLKL